MPGSGTGVANVLLLCQCTYCEQKCLVREIYEAFFVGCCQNKCARQSFFVIWLNYMFQTFLDYYLIFVIVLICDRASNCADFVDSILIKGYRFGYQQFALDKVLILYLIGVNYIDILLSYDLIVFVDYHLRHMQLLNITIRCI